MARASRAASRNDLAGDAGVAVCDADESTPWLTDEALQEVGPSWVELNKTSRLGHGLCALHQRVEAERRQVALVEHDRMAQRDRPIVVRAIGHQVEDRAHCDSFLRSGSRLRATRLERNDAAAVLPLFLAKVLAE